MTEFLTCKIHLARVMKVTLRILVLFHTLCSGTSKNFVKLNLVISSVKTLLSRNFCQKSVRLNRSNFHTTLWKLRNFTATLYSQIFRQINVLLKNFTVYWFDEKKFAWQWICRFSTLCVISTLWTTTYLRHRFAWNQLQQIV